MTGIRISLTRRDMPFPSQRQCFFLTDVERRLRFWRKGKSSRKGALSLRYTLLTATTARSIRDRLEGENAAERRAPHVSGQIMMGNNNPAPRALARRDIEPDFGREKSDTLCRWTGTPGQRHRRLYPGTDDRCPSAAEKRAVHPSGDSVTIPDLTPISELLDDLNG